MCEGNWFIPHLSLSPKSQSYSGTLHNARYCAPTHASLQYPNACLQQSLSPLSHLPAELLPSLQPIRTCMRETNTPTPQQEELAHTPPPRPRCPFPLAAVEAPLSPTYAKDKDLNFQIMHTSCHFPPGPSLVAAEMQQLVYMNLKRSSSRTTVIAGLFQIV
jgi:hypothetical protein